MSRGFCSKALQTRAPWTEVELAQMTESCLAGVQKVFRPEGPRVSQKSLAPVQTRFAPVQPHAALVQRAFCSYFPKDLLRPLQGTLGHISWFDLCPWRLGLQVKPSWIHLIHTIFLELNDKMVTKMWPKQKSDPSPFASSLLQHILSPKLVLTCCLDGSWSILTFLALLSGYFGRQTLMTSASDPHAL